MTNGHRRIVLRVIPILVLGIFAGSPDGRGIASLLGQTLEARNEKEGCLEVFTLDSYDSAFSNPVLLCKNDSLFYYYRADLKTSVCSDKLCRLADLRVFWDLTGRYIQFDTLPGKPLTKYDHRPFSSEDYKILHQTLGDQTSILGEKSKEELISKTGQRYSEKIDGWTGATRKEIKSAIVEGALYSTHTLWHLINGEIGQKIKAHTLACYNTSIEQQLLESKNPDAVIMALERWDEQSYALRFMEVASILKRGNITVNFHIAQNLPQNLLENEENRQALGGVWPYLDEYIRSLLPHPN